MTTAAASDYTPGLDLSDLDFAEPTPAANAFSSFSASAACSPVIFPVMAPASARSFRNGTAAAPDRPSAMIAICDLLAPSSNSPSFCANACSASPESLNPVRFSPSALNAISSPYTD